MLASVMITLTIHSLLKVFNKKAALMYRIYLYSMYEAFHTATIAFVGIILHKS